MSSSKKQRNWKFTAGFTADAAKLVVAGAGGPVAQVTRELKINGSSLAYWVNAYRSEHTVSAASSPVERAKIAALEAQNRRLGEENEFAKKPRPASPGRSREREVHAVDSAEGQPCARAGRHRRVRADLRAQGVLTCSITTSALPGPAESLSPADLHTNQRRLAVPGGRDRPALADGGELVGGRAQAIFHSDRDSQYSSAEFAAVADKLGVRLSVGRTGSCLDNASVAKNPNRRSATPDT